MTYLTYLISLKNIYYTISMIYNFYKNEKLTIPISLHINDKNELDCLQIERLLKWVKIFFNDFNEFTTINDESNKAFKKELHNIYININSDYIQYKQWKEYNKDIIFFSYFRSKNIQNLSKKIMTDVNLFNEGLKMYTLLFKIKD